MTASIRRRLLKLEGGQPPAQAKEPLFIVFAGAEPKGFRGGHQEAVMRLPKESMEALELRCRHLHPEVMAWLAT